MWRINAVLVSAIMLIGQPLVAEPPHHEVFRADSPIHVDGKLDEAAWNVAVPFSRFHFPWWKAGRKEQTVVRMVWDDDCLYLAYQCEDAHVWAEHTERDSPVYKDDCVELFAAPNPQRPNDYFNIEMNVNRAVLDQHHPNGPGKSEVDNWNASGIVVATTVKGSLNDDGDRDNGWILEVAIPFANFAAVTGRVRPEDGDVWHLNLNRLGGKTNPQHSQWSPGTTIRPAFHAPDTFGRVTFFERTSAEQATKSLADAGYRIDPDFLSLPEELTLGACSAVAVNSTGEIYLFHRGRQPILCVSPAGKLLRAWGDEHIAKPHGIRIDPDDNVWVTDTKLHMVFKFSPIGELLLAIGSSEQSGAGENQFDQPTDIAFGPDGEVFVSDGYGNSRVVKLNQRGQFVGSWGTAGKNPGEFNLPHSIVVDAKQRVIVGDRENDRIQVFDLDGKLLDVWPGFAPYGIALDSSQRLFVADGRAQQVLRLDANGKVEQRLGTGGTRPGQFRLPHMLAFTVDGSIIVAEVGGQRFQKLARLKTTKSVP
jgi:streptogramin lyase